MLSTIDFKKRWGEELIQIKPESISNIPFLEKDRKFLIEAGFPEDGPPFLDFDDFNDKLEKIYESWASPSDFSKEDILRLEPFLEIGSGGGGNPIVIDIENDCKVLLLDHEDWFNTITFINSSISQFAEFLLYTAEMIEKANSELTDEELENEIPLKYKTELFKYLSNIDPAAVKEEGFWKVEIGML